MIAHLTAWIVSGAVVLSAPFMGQVRAILRSAFPGRFAVVVAGSVGAAIVVAVAFALVRAKDRRAARYAAILGAVAAGATYSFATASGVPDVDAVERVHFVEYGLISLLFYRAWRAAADVSIVALPIASGLIVGTLEEWFQWFIPNRVGEARDVFLNLVAIGCGLAFSIGLEAPARFSWRLRRGSATAIGLWCGAAALVFALFLNAVHLGYEIRDPETPRFMSRYTSEGLAAEARARTERWRTAPPATLVRLSREDQYMDEGLWHIRRRNESWQANDFAAAWGENRILETFFAPVLDTPSYAAPGVSRWPPAQREDAEKRRPAENTEYVSHAEPYPLFPWPRGAFWLAAIACALAPAAAGLAWDRRRVDAVAVAT
jgi:VanZ family protein